MTLGQVTLPYGPRSPILQTEAIGLNYGWPTQVPTRIQQIVEWSVDRG